ncbi:MAG: hypothetical protein GC181_15890 [Bacteroidetes bacterium]|nr:hypothetical protein [Bacteroidota bacterium]
MTLFVVSITPFVCCAQKVSEENFQNLLTYDTSFYLHPTEGFGAHVTNEFLYSTVGSDVWVAANFNRNRSTITLYNLTHFDSFSLVIPRKVLKKTDGWCPYALHVNDSLLLLQYFNWVAVFKGSPAEHKYKFVNCYELQNCRKSFVSGNYFYAIDDYKILSSEDEHLIYKFNLIDFALTPDTFIKIQTDLPEYSVFGPDFRYVQKGKYLYYLKVGEPYIYRVDALSFTDSFELQQKNSWVYWDKDFLDSLRSVNLNPAYSAHFWISKLRHYKNHHSRTQSMEFVNDSIVLILTEQPKSVEVCENPDNCSGTTTLYELFNVNTGKSLSYGNYYKRLNKNDSLNKNSFPCGCVQGCGNGIWNTEYDYFLEWGAPINPIGKTYGEYVSERDAWLSSNIPILVVRRYKLAIPNE